MIKDIKIKMPSLSWKYTTKLKEHNTLFSNFENINYEIDCYCCSCGNEEFIVKNEFTEVYYECKFCENREFYNLNLAQKDFEYFCRKNPKIMDYLNFEIKLLSDVLYSAYYINIPTHIDFIQNKIVYKKLHIYKIEFNKYEKIRKTFLMKISEDRLRFIKKELENFISLNNISEQYTRQFNQILNKFVTLNGKSFFLEKRNLQDYDFMYWKDSEIFQLEDYVDIDKALRIISNNRKEKSIKKAIYNIHENCINQKKEFNSCFIQAFTKTIRDPNLLVKLIELNLKLSCTFSEIIKFIEFLKSQNYSEKQIFQIFKSEVLVYAYLKDSITDLNFYIENNLNNFKKVKANLKNIHDEFIICTNGRRFIDLENANENINYSNDVKNRCKKIDDFKIVLPKNGIDLYIYATKLNNCMAAYFEEIFEGKTAIYLFLLNDKVRFATEIQNNLLIQASGYSNKELKEEETQALNKWKSLFNIY